jgi:hypothetical protein
MEFASATEAYGGHLAKARDLTKRAVDSAIRTDNKETGAIWEAIAAQREAAYGSNPLSPTSLRGALRRGLSSKGPCAACGQFCVSVPVPFPCR